MRRPEPPDTSLEPPAGESYELVADEALCAVEPDARDRRAVWRALVAPRSSSALGLDVVALEAGASVTLGSDPDRHELVYVLAGAVELARGPERTSIAADAAFLHDGAQPARVLAQTPARLAVFGAGPACDEHALLGERVPCARLDLGDTQSATGRRSFQTLLGPQNGCCRATMFVGAVPPGAAPWHFHQYDEIVYLLDGAAGYHQAGGVQPMAPGNAIRIPPRHVHINENTTGAVMRVLGVFTPAGSPAAAYLAPDPRRS
ncbi:MAG: cupin domain-containing protein [Solirubrobacteraceae bacterium]